MALLQLIFNSFEWNGRPDTARKPSFLVLVMHVSFGFFCCCWGYYKFVIQHGAAEVNEYVEEYSGNFLTNPSIF
jgi:hypothetical protein